MGEEVQEKEQDIYARFDAILRLHEEKVNEKESKYDRFWQKAEDGIAEVKGKHSFALGQKIPASVKLFNKQEVENKLFTAKHSSILRILTKWAENLEEIFNNP